MNTEPIVDIVVPVYGNLGLMRRCLTSVLATAGAARVVVVDDASPERGVRELLRKLGAGGQVTVVRQTVNAGFIEACHAGAAFGRSRYILFLNSDVEVRTPGWLDALIPTGDRVAVTGALLTFPPSAGPLAGAVQHAGVARDSLGWPYHPLYGLPGDHPLAQRAHEVNAVTGACLLVRRDVWETLGGFDLAFGRGMYEDVDFCWRVRQAGFVIRYEPAAHLWHHEHASHVDGRTLHAENLVANRNLLLSRWGALPSDEQLFVAPATVPTAELKRLGVERYRAGDRAGAEGAFQQALAQDPGDVDSIANLGRMHMEAGQLVLAEQYLKAAQRMRPDDPDIPCGLSLLRARKAGNPARLGHRRALGAPDRQTRERLSISAPPRVLFLAGNEVSRPYRMEIPARALAALGWQTRVGDTFSSGMADQYDLFVFSRVLSPRVLAIMQFLRGQGKPIVLDLDDCFHALPPDHPGYGTAGPGNPAALSVLEQAVALADALTVTTSGLGEFYARWARRVVVAPNCWSRENARWLAPRAAHAGVVLGWAGTITHGRDVLQMRAGVLAAMDACPRSQLVIGGDAAVYDAFAAVPVSRRRYLAGVSFDQYPDMLTQFDVLLAPLEPNDFNRFKSDVKVLEAGVRGIPWVASAAPAYSDWADGGLLVNGPGRWQAAVARVLEDEALRKQLGVVGHARAQAREIEACVGLWAGLYEDVVREGQRSL